MFILSYFDFTTVNNQNMIYIIYFHSNTGLLVKFVYHCPWIYFGVKLTQHSIEWVNLTNENVSFWSPLKDSCLVSQLDLTLKFSVYSAASKKLIKSAPRPSRWLHRRCIFLWPYDEIADQACCCFLPRWHSGNFRLIMN